MSSSTNLSLEERFEALTRHHEILMKSLSENAQHEQETKAQIECLRKQLGVYLKQNQQANEEPPKFDSKRQEPLFNYTLDSSCDDEHLRMTRPNPQIQVNTNDLEVEILKFEGKLDPEEFLDGLHTVVRVF